MYVFNSIAVVQLIRDCPSRCFIVASLDMIEPCEGGIDQKQS